LFRGKRLGLALWGTEPAAALVRHATLAESIGFDSVWVIDSRMLCREVTVTLAAILMATQRIRAATGVTQPVTRHASVMASAMATLSELIARALGWLEGAAVEVSCWTPYSLGADAIEARGRVAGALMNAQPEWFNGVERAAMERLRTDYDVGHHAASAADHAAIVPDSLVDRYAIAGTAAEVRDQLRRLLDTPGVDRVILNLRIVGPGAKPLETVLREFEQEILPGL
jgi:alkanesulfonate monooxygenase SsuD/methylene tetrahydromethanopterin reductase-like flavin-dependent oxidoreductase (luciferase family)